MVSRQRIYLVIGEKGKLRDVLVNLVIEENNREDVKEVLNDAVNLIYDDEYEDNEDE
jgi:hypothetical protein